MAVSWWSALKVIPWGDVIDAAPNVVKGARKMFARTQTVDQPPPGETGEPVGFQERVAHLESGLALLQDQQQASAKLIETLAEQNARLVDAVEILRVRTRLLLVVSGALVLAAVGLALVWALR